jgi:cellobiose phosphorylase
MRYGYFDDEKQEYVITNPKTPVKWINYVGTLPFGGIVDHTGGALICKGDPALNRITKYIPQLPSSEFKGTTRTLSLRWALTICMSATLGWAIPGLSPSSMGSGLT